MVGSCHIGAGSEPRPCFCKSSSGCLTMDLSLQPLSASWFGLVCVELGWVYLGREWLGFGGFCFVLRLGLPIKSGLSLNSLYRPGSA